MPERPQPVIVTDLDGTLLDRDTYSHREARAAIGAALSARVPLVFCSSKTRAEQLAVRATLGVRDPFIVEDGGAIFIEEGYFGFDFTYHRIFGSFRVIELGTPIDIVRQTVEVVRSETGIPLRGYGDMTVDAVADATGLDHQAAALAMKREYQETLVSRHQRDQLETLTGVFAQHGLRLTKGGRFLAVSGQHDKGVAVKILEGLYRREFGEVRTIGIGDSHNDLAMLAAVDVPVLVQKRPREWEDIATPNLVRVEGVGPGGWNRFVMEFLANAR